MSGSASLTHFDRLLERICELFSKDEELHDALVELIRANAQSKRELARWRSRRIPK